MEDLLSAVVAALVIGASTIAKEVASDAARDAYQALKAGIIRKLGRQGAVQSVEDDPDSQAAQTALIEALAAKHLPSDDELVRLAGNVIRFSEAEAPDSRSLDASIEIGRVRGSVGAIVERFCATGRIRLGEVIADQGEVRVSDLSAGTDIIARLPRSGGAPGVEKKLKPADGAAPATSVFSDFSAGRDIVVHLGNSATATKFSGKIQAFFEEYLVTETGTERVPFGGRGKELEYLDRWLNDPMSPSRLVLVGPAGRGKSALLVNWMVQLTASPEASTPKTPWHVVFVPISIRFSTNRPAIFYEAIAARLAEILEIDLRPPQTDPGAYYEDQCRILVRSAMKQGRRTLIIIDGADEALGNSFEARWFPRKSEGTLRLLISARLQIGDVDARGWVRRLGWESGVRCGTLELPSLDAAGVKNLLVTSGAPLDYLAARPDIVNKLHRLSEGEPLILRLYVEDLWLRGQGSQELTVEDLDHIQPGLSGYFEDWLARQQDVWREDRKDGVPIDSTVLGVQLALLACAHGPLSAEDIGALLRQCGCGNDGLRVEDGLYPLRRFVIGAGRRLGDDYHGYVLSHPRFGQFLREDYLDASQVARARAALASWGDDVVRCTNAGALPSGQVPRYVLTYHSQHLLDAGISSDGFMAMVEPGWLQACEAHEGGYRGFSEDVAAAMNALLREQPRVPNWRSSLIRCALFQVSVASLVSQVPEEVVLPCVQAGFMSARQVLHWLDFHPQEVRCRVLVQLSPLLDDADVAAALEACRSLSEDMLRARALAAVVARLGGGERHAVATEALSSLFQQHAHSDGRPLGPEDSKLVGDTLTCIAICLDAAEIAQAAIVARAMSFDEGRVLAFLALGSAAPVDERQSLFRQALASVSGVRDNRQRHELLRRLTPRLGLELLYPLINAVCDGESGENVDRPVLGDFIDELMAQLSTPYQILAFEAAIRLENQAARYKIAANILSHVPKDQLVLPLLTSLASIRHRTDQFRLLSNLAEFFTAPIVAVVIRHAQFQMDEHGVAAAIGQMAPRLSEAAADQALMLALQFDNEGARAEALFALAPRVSASVVGQVMDAASDLRYGQDRVKLLASIIPRVPAHMMHAARVAIAGLTDPSLRINGLLALTSGTAGAEQVALIREALSIASGASSQYERTDSILASVAAIAECESIQRAPLLGECLRQCLSLRKNDDFLQVLKTIGQQLMLVESASVFGVADDGKEQVDLCGNILRRLSLCSSLDALEQAASWVPASLLPDLMRVAAKVANVSYRESYSLVSYSGVVAAALARLPDQERAEHLRWIFERLEAPQEAVSERRAAAYAVLAPHLPARWIVRGLEAASAIADGSSRASALAELVTQLPAADRTEWLALALLALRTAAPQPGQYSAAILKRLIPLLPGDPLLPGELLTIAVELTISLANDSLADCIKRVPEDQRAQVLAPAIERVGAELIVTAVETSGPEVLDALASAALRVRNEDQRATTLAALARRSSEEGRMVLLKSAIEAASAIRNDTHRARILAGVAADLPTREAADVLKEALRSSRTIGDDILQFNVLVALLNHLPSHLGSELASQAVTRLPSILHAHGRCALLQSLSCVLDRSQWLSLVANEVASAIAADSDREKSTAWCALAPLLSEEQLVVAWRSAIGIKNAQDLLRAVSSLAERVPEPLIDALLQDLRQCPGEIRDELTVVLAPRVPLHRMPEFFTVLADMRDQSMRARALLATAPRTNRQEVLRQAVELARNIGDTVTLARGLIATIETEKDSPENVALVRATLDTVLTIPYSREEDRMAALQALLPHLTPQMLPIVLQEAPHGSVSLGAVVAILRPKLSDGIVMNLLAPSMWERWKPGGLMETIAALGPTLPAGLHVKAFKVLQEWEEDAARIPALAKLLPYVDDSSKDDALISLAECAARLDREVVLKVLPDYAPMILRTEGPEGAARIGRSLLEVGKCFA